MPKNNNIIILIFNLIHRRMIVNYSIPHVTRRVFLVLQGKRSQFYKASALGLLPILQDKRSPCYKVSAPHVTKQAIPMLQGECFLCCKASSPTNPPPLPISSF